jgi:flagellar protein FliS
MSGANAYKKMAVQTATPGQILIMLYEAAIQNIRKAIVCMDNKDLSNKGKYIVKTHDIINELINSLNFEVGGDIAKDLERLYNFCVQQLIKGNIENKKEHLQSVQKILEDLLSAWKVAVNDAQRNAAKTLAKGV